MSTAPQRNRSDMLRGPRGLHEQCQNSQRTTARAIWQAQSDERIGRKNHFIYKCRRKMPNANPATTAWFEPARSKCTWTFHKNDFIWKLKGKCKKLQLPPRLNTGPETLIVKLALIVKTLQRGHTVWGKKVMQVRFFTDWFEMVWNGFELLLGK